MDKVEIPTGDGVCPSYLFQPAGGGPWPAVLMYMDGVGIRPMMLALGEQLATHGYCVLLPDLFYRAGPYEPMNAREVFSDPEKIKALRQRFGAHASPHQIMADTRAFLDYLAAQPQVKPGGIGTTGYCMGGRMSFLAAATYPDRVVAAACYHPGGLVNDQPDSPHLLAAQIRAKIYIAAASDDPSFPDEAKAKVAQALAAAGVDHTLETYPAKHGWVLADTPVYDAAATERHWQTMTALFAATLKTKGTGSLP
jgi:carboxymethylenebutenolidase